MSVPLFSNSLHSFVDILHSYYAITLLCHHLTVPSPYCAITLHINQLVVILDAETLLCQSKPNITTNFFSGPSFQAHSQCPSSYPMNSTSLTDSCAICYMLPLLQMLASTKKLNALRQKSQFRELYSLTVPRHSL